MRVACIPSMLCVLPSPAATASDSPRGRVNKLLPRNNLKTARPPIGRGEPDYDFDYVSSCVDTNARSKPNVLFAVEVAGRATPTTFDLEKTQLARLATNCITQVGCLWILASG